MLVMMRRKRAGQIISKFFFDLKKNLKFDESLIQIKQDYEKMGRELFGKKDDHVEINYGRFKEI